MDFDSLKNMFEMHIKECDGRDARNSKSFDEIKSMFKGIWDAQDKTSEKLTNLQIKFGVGIVTLILIGKALDYYIAWFHK